MDGRGKVERVKGFLDRNVLKKVTLEEAAASVALSPKYLSRIFKQHTSEGFNAYKLKGKIRQAKLFLQKTGYNIDQIADKLGYQNPESFIRQFKKIVKSTPTEFRRKFRKTSVTKKKQRF